MNSFYEDESNPPVVLPPKICNNPRAKIGPSQIDPRSLLPHAKKKEKPRDAATQPLVSYSVPKTVSCPKSPLAIIWSPDRLCFDLEEKAVERKLHIWNACSRMIYIHCCGLWNETARLGASWRSFPRTRFLLAPGMKSELYVKATPRTHSPIPASCLCLQIAASHKRDTVTAFFAVPVIAKFTNYIPLITGEGGE